jgi:hypothetical protein
MQGYIQRAISFSVFGVGALATGFFTLGSLMLGVWGAPTSWIQYAALVASALLFFSAFVCLFRPVNGRGFAAFSILGIGVLYIPASASLVPAAALLVSPIGYLVVAGYFALLAFALFFPRRWRWSIPVFVCCLLAGAAFAATTYFHRLARGELHWPSLVYFEWIPTSEPLQIQYDTDGWITPSLQEALTKHGVTGVLRWTGSQGAPTESRRVIVVCRSRISVPKDLHYPKRGAVIYIFDGAAWKSLPDHPDVYAAHATLEPDGMLTQLCPGGGSQGGAAFTWR